MIKRNKDKKKKNNNFSFKENIQTNNIKINNYFNSYEYKKDIIKNKNSSVGRTYKINDNDLPHTNKGSGKIVNISSIAENNLGEIAVVRMTTQDTKNTRKFNNPHRLYKGYKTFVETQLQDGSVIKPNDKRLQENTWENNLTKNHLAEINKQVFIHSKQAQRNNKLIDIFKKRNKKSEN